MRGESVPVIFGIKLKQFREERGFAAKHFAEMAGLSPSYLNEIEKGKKYPKSEKILQIADALQIPYDDLVSLKLDQGLEPLETLLASPILQELPLQAVGISLQDVIGLVTKSPKKAVALVRTLGEIAHSYNMRVEHFFYAMLRSYQEAHDNYFEEIEEEADRFAATHGWDRTGPTGYPRLAGVLTGEFGVVIDEETIAGQPELGSFRSIWIEGDTPRLLINARLTPAQKAFQVGREIGYRLLGLKERGITSSRAEVTSFEQVLNDFKASYFAGALLIDRSVLVAGLTDFFGAKKCVPADFLALMEKHGVTPEMFLYRLTQIIPTHFQLSDFQFFRFGRAFGGETVALTKQFKMASGPRPPGIGQNEHHCRRWVAVRILADLEERQRRGDREAPIVAAQIARFVNSDTEYFYLSLARPFALTRDNNSGVTLGFRLNDQFKAAARFWNDPDIPRATVNEACERCGLSPAQCSERSAPPTINDQLQNQASRKRALEELLAHPPGAQKPS